MQQEWPDAKRYGSVLKSSTVNATGMAWRKEVWVCIKIEYGEYNRNDMTTRGMGLY